MPTETVEEKRTRLAKEYIEKVGEEEKDDFIDNLKADEPMDKDEYLTSLLERKAAEKKGTYQYTLADELTWSEPTFVKGHKKTITDFHLTGDGATAYSVSKDCCIL